MDFAISEFKWGDTPIGSPGGQVHWSFATRSSYGGYTFEAFIVEAVFQELVRDAFQAWENIANIDFVEVADGASSEIRLGWDSIDGSNGTVGEASYSGITDSFYNPRDPRYSITEAEIRFDLAETWSTSQSSADPNNVSFYAVALHEIGHALGLDHTDNVDTIMYPSITDLIDLAPGDIAGAQAIYGASSLSQLFAVQSTIAKGLSAAYDTLLGGVPNEAGYKALIETAVSTNFGAGAGPAFNEENVFINLTNNLVGGNATAAANFKAIAGNGTLAEKIEAIYEAIVPPSAQTAGGLAYLTRPEGLAFYQQVADQRGIDSSDGPAIVALASLLNVVVRQDVGIGDAVNDLMSAVLAASDMLPASGNVFTSIEIADGTAFDGDDAAANAITTASAEHHFDIASAPVLVGTVGSTIDWI